MNTQSFKVRKYQSTRIFIPETIFYRLWKPLLLALFVLVNSTLFGQTDTISAMEWKESNPQEFALSVSYVEDEESYYLVENAENLTQLDMASIIEQKFTRIIEKYYVNEYDFVTKIYYEDMQGAFKVGAKPTLMVIDRKGSVIYDDSDEVLSSHNRDEELAEPIELNKLYLSLTLPSESELQKIEDEGGEVIKDEAKLEISMDGIRLQYKNNRMFLEQTFYGEDEDMLGKQQIVYEELPTGQSVLRHRKVTSYVNLPSGACAELVQKYVYSNYQFDDRRDIEPRSTNMKAQSSTHFEISPNPISDVLFADYSGMFEESEQLGLSIYTLDGIMIKRLKVENSGPVKVPVEEMEGGVYLLKVSDNSGRTLVKKFVKL